MTGTASGSRGPLLDDQSRLTNLSTPSNSFYCSSVDMTFRSYPRHWLYQAWFILFFRFVLATLQNVTVDDAVQTGSTAPIYLPSPSYWNQGNTCTGCYAQPDPSLAYNGTWHDSTFVPTTSITQAFTFTFVGSGVYIFFILANTIPGDPSSGTSVIFTLDEVQVSAFTHSPSATSDSYEYNQAVYANDSIPYGLHTMLVSPVNISANLLMLFDYYVYTVDASNATTTVAGGSVPTTVLPSPSSVSSATSLNIGAIVGGAVGGLGAIVIVTASLLCYRRHKRRTAGSSYSQSGWAIDAPIVQTTQALSENIQPPSIHKGNVSVSLPSSGPSMAMQSSSSGAEFLEQMEWPRDNVMRMQHMQNQWGASKIVMSPPPEYS